MEISGDMGLDWWVLYFCVGFRGEGGNNFYGLCFCEGVLFQWGSLDEEEE